MHSTGDVTYKYDGEKVYLSFWLSLDFFEIDQDRKAWPP